MSVDRSYARLDREDGSASPDIPTLSYPWQAPPRHAISPIARSKTPSESINYYDHLGAPSSVSSRDKITSGGGGGVGAGNIDLAISYHDTDDWGHDIDLSKSESVNFFSWRGWLNFGTLFIICGGIIAVFLFMPMWAEYKRYLNQSEATVSGYNLGGINATGQVPMMPNMPTLIDRETPANAYSRVGFDGKQWDLVFSDEFETEGRTFWPGDDPYWEAVDLHYWQTGDLEWYHPSAISTKDGHLVIEITEESINGLDFKSGMLQSWNKLCVSGSMYLEVSLVLPGDNKVGGFWPGVWTFGNLGRAGYGATTDGMWPYSYDSCDIGTLANQTNIAGTGPDAALSATNFLGQEGTLSYLPGQRLSSCTCAGEDHPGPSPSVGRGVPEVDALEAGLRVDTQTGMASQTMQLAPFDANYLWNNSTAIYHDPSITEWNSYTGGVYQECASGLATIPDSNYAQTSNVFTTYGFEMYANKNDRANSYITWLSDGKQSWTLPASGLKADPATEVSDRLIPEEPMTIILNLGMSNSFQPVDLARLTFPSQLKIDYVRVYQRPDFGSIGCDPADYPTVDYIARHANAYYNRNLTTWEATGNTVPKNRLRDQC